jgi:hypothetical protein
LEQQGGSEAYTMANSIPETRAALNVLRLLRSDRSDLIKLFDRERDLRVLVPAVFRIIINSDASDAETSRALGWTVTPEEVREFILEAMDAKIEGAWRNYQHVARAEIEPNLGND